MQKPMSRPAATKGSPLWVSMSHKSLGKQPALIHIASTSYNCQLLCAIYSCARGHTVTIQGREGAVVYVQYTTRGTRK